MSENRPPPPVGKPENPSFRPNPQCCAHRRTLLYLPEGNVRATGGMFSPPEGIVVPTGGYCCTYRRVMSRCRRVLLHLPEGIVVPAGGHCLHCRRVLLCQPEGIVYTTGRYCWTRRRGMSDLPVMVPRVPANRNGGPLRGPPFRMNRMSTEGIRCPS